MTSANTASGPARIVVGVDGSESSKEALRWAARLAPALDATIQAVLTWAYPTNFGWGGVGVPGNWNPDDDARKALVQTVDDVFGPDRPIGLTAEVREGQAGATLIDASKEAAMLIVGSRGHGGFAGLLLGSVSAACAEHATCPVLVVHEQNLDVTSEIAQAKNARASA
jgi:nucleotide-binding universal stress UspA family protein